MSASLEKLGYWMRQKENEHLEFKEAKNRFDCNKLAKYSAAIANEGGGRIILGITNKIPRTVVGTQAFRDIEKIKSFLIDQLHLRIEVDTINHPDGRVLVFTVPSRAIGFPINYKGAYWMRGGEDLIPMTQDMLKRIFAESQPDFSSEICPEASLSDLSTKAIENFRTAWYKRSKNEALIHQTREQLLADAELVVDDNLTYAALILLGNRQALGKYLPQAEVVFEYRSTETYLAYQQRKEYREGFFLCYDGIWEVVNLRNEKYQYQDGLFFLDIPTFNEAVIREAILNAVSHREYRLSGSIFIRQFPSKIEIVSPGGFPPGITVENILWKQSPRNRRIAEVFSKCGLVERSGQGVNRMFEECVKEGKLPPDFSETDDYQVFLTLHGKVQEPQFLRFLEKIGKETFASFNTEDLLVLDLVHRRKKVPDNLRERLQRLVEIGVLEQYRRKYLLSRRYYTFIGKKGVYTRKRGLDQETNKALLLKHIQDNRETGSQIHELMDVLPSLSRDQIKWLLHKLELDGLIKSKGKTRAGRWHII